MPPLGLHSYPQSPTFPHGDILHDFGFFVKENFCFGDFFWRDVRRRDKKRVVKCKIHRSALKKADPNRALRNLKGSERRSPKPKAQEAG